MSSFSADWLALREPLDAASRAARLGTALSTACAAGQSRNARLEVVDLGAGTGANLRYAAPLLGGSQRWLLIERDPMLLTAMTARMPDGIFRGTTFDCRVEVRALDLASELDSLALSAGTLLTASALLDLVSEAWLRTLLRRAAAAAATVWFALTYDGRIDCLPAEPEDPEVRDLFNQHQLGDKGFGAALGPGAAPLAGKLLAEHGYHIERASSDWHVGPEQPALQRALLDGWFKAACEVAPDRASTLTRWLARRQAHIDGARSTLQVGHADLVGLAPHDGA